MNISNIKIFLNVLKSTSNLHSVTKQSKALLYIDNPYCTCIGIIRPRRLVNERIENGVDVREQKRGIVFNGGETNEHDRNEFGI